MDNQFDLLHTTKEYGVVAFKLGVIQTYHMLTEKYPEAIKYRDVIIKYLEADVALWDASLEEYFSRDIEDD